MNYLNQYKSFINSHYLTEGLRMTAGVILPALVFGYFDKISIGIVFSLGALMVSVTDSPGPVHHRRNGMLVCLVFIFAGALITGFIGRVPALLAFYLVVVCFFFSMITIYGARAASIGTAAMIMITLTIDPRRQLNTPFAVLQHAGYVVAGGLWYVCYSLALYNFRPLRLARQALGDCMEATAHYLELRSHLYNSNADYDSIFRHILHQQAIVQQKQNDLSELLFKTRSVTKDSTVESRSLVMMFLDLTDIFEKIMTSHQQYSLLHKYFDDTNILTDFGHLAKYLAQELNRLGIAVKSGHAAHLSTNIFIEIDKAYEKLEELRHSYLKPGNIEGFISLRKILENIKDIADRLKLLQQYSAYDKKLAKKNSGIDVKQFTTSQDYSFGLLINNLSLKSDTFRHAIRVSAAVLVGYLVAQSFKIGHSYWVLLTIIVILKPAYSLTKKRNGQRLAGTIAGVGIGIGILYLTNNSKLLLILLMLFMVGNFSSMRRNYFMSVLFMTPYLVLFYHLLSPADFYVLLKDRIVDTVIGSVIAFLASYLLFPSWEKDKIKPAIINMLQEARNYFALIAEQMNGAETSKAALQLARRKALVTLANLSDSFTRMISEPESRQKGIEKLHKLIVLNHTFTSYIAGFSQYTQQQYDFPADELSKAARDILGYLDSAVDNLNGVKSSVVHEKQALRNLNEMANQLLEKRKKELEHGWVDTKTRHTLIKVKSVVDQLNLLYNVAVDINKMSKAYLEQV